jgi:hypothetical protein
MNATIDYELRLIGFSAVVAGFNFFQLREDLSGTFNSPAENLSRLSVCRSSSQLRIS